MATQPTSHAADRVKPRLPKTPVPGGRLGRFELLASVAKGGMGTIWAARETPSGPIVAVKTLHSEGADELALRNMFIDEARIAMACRHPNICRVFEVGEDQGTLFLAMEWIDGDALQNVLVGGRRSGSESVAEPFPEAIALRVVRRVCDALHQAHELVDAHGQPLGLVHRDVSPHNVLLATNGTVKLIDFGIAKARRRISQTTHSGVVKGKLRYMAPEQLDGGNVDRRADVWSLGAVLYLLASGEELFASASEADVVRTLVMRAPLPQPSHPMPSAVAAIVARALSFEVDDRFPDTQAMRRAAEARLVELGESLDDAHDRAVLAKLVGERVGQEVSSRRVAVDDAVTTIDRPSRPGRPTRRVWPIAVAATLVCVVAVLGLAFGRSGSPPSAPALVVAASDSPPRLAVAPSVSTPSFEIVEAPAPASAPKKLTKAGTAKAPTKKPGSEFDHHD